MKLVQIDIYMNYRSKVLLVWKKQKHKVRKNDRKQNNRRNYEINKLLTIVINIFYYN